MNTPVCDKNSWNTNRDRLYGADEFVVDLEVAKDLEIKLEKALEALKREHRNVRLYEERRELIHEETECNVCKLITELEAP